MIKLKSDGYVFVSDLGIEYELLEGVSMGAEKQYTSDIVFIMLMDANYNVDTNFVDYVYGATLWKDESNKNYIEDCVETIRASVKKYEERNNITEKIVEDEILEETCPHCDYINEYKVSEAKDYKDGKKIVVCQSCGSVILACSLCDGNGCGKCSL